MLKNKQKPNSSILQIRSLNMFMDSSRNSIIANLAIFSLLFAGLLYICLWSTPSSTLLISSLHHSNNKCRTSEFRNIKFPIDELEMVLEKAATPNKTVVIAVVNKAYVEQGINSETTMFDLFIESFWVGEETRPLIKHLLVVAADQTAYERCMFKRLNCYKLTTDGVDFGREALYMSPAFIKMMWRRTLLLLDVLKHGYNFIFTDTDVMWLRNPFPRLSKNGTDDLQISTDVFFGNNIDDGKQLINTGFYFMRSNNKTIALLDKWYGMKDNSTGKKEQDVLLDLLRGGFFKQLGLQTLFLDTQYFSGFCQDSKDVRAVVTVHANCCRSIKAKVQDLSAVLRDWKRFKAVAAAEKSKLSAIARTFQWTGHFGCWNSWGPSNNTN
ncbi:hypothetical protein HS088_TW08G00858 [Tripterygium wilfordii]|uniref:Nucleotide-diphospho-sugar transferase domain-containing protein n=1 Tax=Tripterygium wilfordii TaxID=458696 RepID=A0A7J7DDC7_TRIWF|nr:uncharacterized protein At1g28695-like [Tripterygium wilfordii]KAF5744258.1 hypothetical protein HS088_TW08G00858 [Tripterygium wilfordii]